MQNLSQEQVQNIITLKAGGTQFVVDSIYEDEKTVDGSQRKLLRVTLPPGQVWTAEMLSAMASGDWEILDRDMNLMSTQAGYTERLPLAVEFLKTDDSAAQIALLEQQTAALSGNVQALEAQKTQLSASLVSLETEKAEIAQQAEEAQGLVTVLGQTLRVVADALPDEQAANFPNLYGELVGDEQPVPAGQRRTFNGELYAAKVTLWDRPDQQPDQQPDLWRKITKTGEIENWVQPSGAHDAYPIGAKVTHNGKRWVSTADGNVWEPAEGALWKQI